MRRYQLTAIGGATWFTWIPAHLKIVREIGRVTVGDISSRGTLLSIHCARSKDGLGSIYETQMVSAEQAQRDQTLGSDVLEAMQLRRSRASLRTCTSFLGVQHLCGSAGLGVVPFGTGS